MRSFKSGFTLKEVAFNFRRLLSSFTVSIFLLYNPILPISSFPCGVSNKIYLSLVLEVVLVGCNSNSTLKMFFYSFLLSFLPLPPFTELIYQNMPGNSFLDSNVLSEGFGMPLPLHRRTFCLLRE